MRLNDPLATSIFFEGKKYPLNLSFNRVLDAFEVLERKDLMKGNKVKLIIRIFVGETDLNLKQQIELWSLIMEKHINLNNKQVITYDLEGNPMPIKNEEQSELVIDLEQDAKYIYASFRQIGINLYQEQNKMQWSEFQALLEALPDDTIMQKIIQIRLWKPQKGESAKYKDSMRRLQDKYRIGEVGEDEDE